MPYEGTHIILLGILGETICVARCCTLYCLVFISITQGIGYAISPDPHIFTTGLFKNTCILQLIIYWVWVSEITAALIQCLDQSHQCPNPTSTSILTFRMQPAAVTITPLKGAPTLMNTWISNSVWHSVLLTFSHIGYIHTNTHCTCVTLWWRVHSPQVQETRPIAWY